MGKYQKPFRTYRCLALLSLLLEVTYHLSSVVPSQSHPPPLHSATNLTVVANASTKIPTPTTSRITKPMASSVHIDLLKDFIQFSDLVALTHTLQSHNTAL